jgi:hypothetical protein
MFVHVPLLIPFSHLTGAAAVAHASRQERIPRFPRLNQVHSARSWGNANALTASAGCSMLSHAPDLYSILQPWSSLLCHLSLGAWET